MTNSRLNPHPVARGHKSLPPPAWPGAAHRRRRILRPYGPGHWPSFTLDTFTTADAARTGWRLYEHDADGSRTVLFEREDLPSVPGDPDAEVVAALDWACVQPGDVGDERMGGWTPVQLAFGMRHAAVLREEARRRLGWADPGRLAPMRLDLAYEARRDLASHLRHRMRLGVVEAAGRTRVLARAAFHAALRNHVSDHPTLRWGGLTGAAYLLYPSGSEWVVQRAAPGQEPGEPMRLGAADSRTAREALERTLNQVETPARGAPASRRPHARAGSGVYERAEVDDGAGGDVRAGVGGGGIPRRPRDAGGTVG